MRETDVGGGEVREKEERNLLRPYRRAAQPRPVKPVGCPAAAPTVTYIESDTANLFTVAMTGTVLLYYEYASASYHPFGNGVFLASFRANGNMNRKCS